MYGRKVKLFCKESINKHRLDNKTENITDKTLW